MIGWQKYAVFGLVITAVVAVFGIALGGYKHGKNVAEAEAEAAMNAYRLDVEEERRDRAEVYGKSLADALEKSQAEVKRADNIAAQYAKAKKEHAKNADALNKKIASAVRGSEHIFTGGFVRLYNEAIGLSGDALSETLCPRQPDGRTGAGAAACEELMDGVTEADVLQHISYYGKRCRGLEAQVLGWQELERGRQ